MPGFNRAPFVLASPALAVATDHPADPGLTPEGTSWSETLWGLNLNSGLPHVLSNDGVLAIAGELTRVSSFLAQEFPGFGEESLGALPSATVATAKRCYLQTACDVIEIRHGDRTVGVLVGGPEDWSTYYIRIFAVIQAYQRPSLIRRFARDCVFGPMSQHHVERVVAESSPANLAMARTFTELHFHVTGHQLSDRWGPLVRYTRFLDPACEAAFLKRFAGIAAGGPTRTGKEEPP